MSEIPVDIGSRLEVSDGLALPQCRDERRAKVIEEGLSRKAQSHTGQGGNVTIHGIHGGRITDKLHLHRGEIRDRLNPCKGESDNQSQGQAELATSRLIRHPREDERKVLPQLAVITTYLAGRTIVAAGNVLTLEIDDPHPSTGLFRHAEHRPPAQDQAQEVNLPQLTHTSQDGTDATRRICLPG